MTGLQCPFCIPFFEVHPLSLILFGPLRSAGFAANWPQLRNLKLDNNLIFRLSADELSNASRLEYITLEACPLRAVALGAFTALPSLFALDIRSSEDKTMLQVGVMEEVPSVVSLGWFAASCPPGCVLCAGGGPRYSGGCCETAARGWAEWSAGD